MKSLTLVKCQRHVLIWSEWDINWADSFPSKDRKRWKWFFAILIQIQMVSAYCFLFYSFNWSSNYFLIDRQTKMDRIQRRQIGVRPFLRSAEYQVQHNWNSNSVRFGAGERGKRHEFNNGEIHGTATGNLFFFIHGTGGSSSFIFCLFRSKNLFERGSNREEFSWWSKH